MFNKILVPLDGSELAAKVLPKVTEMAKTFKAQVTLIHVCYTPAIGETTPETMKAAAAHEEKWCATFLGKVAGDLKAQGLDVKTECVEGVPAREIIHYADKNNMDLIAMTTHGIGEVAWVLGSTAEKVVSHATVPVLLFRVIEFKPPLLKEVYYTTPGVG
ncbi:MAG: universal stress protein [Deltaproteobacteria bacterium]|nr:universal stress protein [Deltaproteobacteria bacterium]MBI4795796.1 universal stress protein [Deltaproteobacteria bacterium]